MQNDEMLVHGFIRQGCLDMRVRLFGIDITNLILFIYLNFDKDITLLEKCKIKFNVYVKDIMESKIQKMEQIVSNALPSFFGFTTEIVQDIYINIQYHIDQSKGPTFLDLQHAEDNMNLNKMCNWWMLTGFTPMGNLLYSVLFLDLLKTITSVPEVFSQKLAVFIDIWITIIQSRFKNPHNGNFELLINYKYIADSHLLKICINFIYEFGKLQWNASKYRTIQETRESLISTLQMVKMTLDPMNNKQYIERMTVFLIYKGL